MPSPEHQLHPTTPETSQPAALLDSHQESEQEQARFKTIAVRVHEELHAQLSFIAQLSGTSISEEIRTAIEARISGAQEDPDLIARAHQAREQIEREAAARTAAIAGFMGSSAVAKTTTRPTSKSRRATGKTNQ